MTALTQSRNTLARAGNLRSGSLAAAQLIFAGALLMRNADGDLVAGTTATGLVGVGRAERPADNSAGAAGDLRADYLPGTYLFENSAGADEITAAEIGAICFAVDDQTVAKTDGTATRSPAGIVEEVSSDGVWVRFDEALTAAMFTADAAAAA